MDKKADMIRLPGILLFVIFTSTSTQRDFSYRNDRNEKLIVAYFPNGTRYMKICDNGFTLHEASVACRTFGNDTNHIHIVLRTDGKRQSGLVQSSSEGCKGSETNLSQCYRAREGTCLRGYVQVICESESKDIRRLKENQIVTVNPKTVRGYVNDNVTVTCVVEPLSKKTLRWLRYEWSYSTHNATASSPSVTVNLKRDEDLTCNVYYRNIKLKQQGHSSLEVYYPPPLYQSHNVTVVENTTLDFRHLSNNRTDQDKISNPEPNRWQQRLGGNSLKDGYLLPLVKKKHAGMYVVQMTNEMNVTQGRARNGSGVMVVHLHVIEAPVCRNEYFAIVNSTLTINCTQSNWAMNLNVNWTKDGKMKESRSSYTINPVKMDDEGNYSCAFSYSNITDNGRRINDTIHACNKTLKVFNITKSVTVWEGGNTTLIKEDVDGQSWFKLVSGKIKRKKPLQTYNVTRSNVGTYINEDKNASLQLNVLYEHEVKCPSRRSVEQGSSLTLTCDVKAYSGFDPNITWQLPNKDPNSTKTEGQVSLNDVTERDEGVYTCNVSANMKDDWNVSKAISKTCSIEVIVYDDDSMTLVVVCAVFSVCVLALAGTVVYLSRRLYCGRHDKIDSDTGVSLPMKSTTNTTKKVKEPSRRQLPNAPNIPLPNSPGDLQQDVYENT